MKIILAKKAGFCFGVKRAIDMVLALKDKSFPNETIFTLGPIIHNHYVIEELKQKGIIPLDEHELDQLDKGVVVIRTHGVAREVEKKLLAKGIQIIDTTCPYVKKVHGRVRFLESRHYQVVILGQANHPEVQGIVGQCEGIPYVIQDIHDISKIANNNERIGVVAQTTMLLPVYQELIGALCLISKEMLSFNTICFTTEARQNEACGLAQYVNKMLVIGGKNSSNSNKLYQVCKAMLNSRAHFIENPSEIDLSWLQNEDIVGITGGASTPHQLIDQTILFLKNHFDVSCVTYNSILTSNPPE